ncbi:MAG: trypsin-like peptidase domain-containing protein [Bdellovibrionaceae bacterium]|nr:trypsin-like peptidase domain-containing protein [Pseudobdellovibrionaceae bacterium]
MPLNLKILSIGLLSTLLLLPAVSFATSKADLNEEPKTIVEKPWLLEDEKNTIRTFNDNANSVVFVSTKAYVRDFFSSDVYEVPAGAGTGFIWDNHGHIVTNFHVVEGNARGKPVSVTLKDGRSFDAKIVGFEPHKDIAVLKLTSNVKNLPEGFSSRLADSSQLQVGQKTIAIGNPFELSHTLTTGVVSALERTVPSPVPGLSNRDMIQTDAAINPGNSGGPLMDSRGFLIGMNSSIYSQSGTSAGVGFAVPSNAIKRVVTQLIKTGKVSQPGFGIATLRDELARYLGVSAGVVIKAVSKNSSAAKAGLRPVKVNRNGKPELGDIIVGIDNHDINSLDDILNVLDGKMVGDTVKVVLLREGKKITIDVKLQEVKE